MRDENVRQQINSEITRTYASTAVSGEGQAVLGDISQDVNILGDVHVHVHAPFQQALAFAGSVTRFLHFCEQLRQSGRESCQQLGPQPFQARLVEQDFPRVPASTNRVMKQPVLIIAREEQFRRLVRLSNELYDIIPMLANEQDKWHVPNAGRAPEQVGLTLFLFLANEAAYLICSVTTTTCCLSTTGRS